MTRSIPLLSALAVLFAAPAFAQNCGGVGTGGIWIGGDAAGSDIATADAPLNQLALVLAGNNYISLFSLSQDAEVRLEAQGNGDGDPVIELFDESGTSIGFDDDSGGNAASRLETDLQPGSYCMTLGSFGGAPMTGTVRIGRTEQEPLTAGVDADEPEGTDLLPPQDEPAGATIGCGMGSTIADGDLDGILPDGATATAPVSEVSGYDFSISEPATITITAENVAADPVLTLKDASGTVLYENDDFDGLNSRIDVAQPLAPGDYCIELRALADASLPVTVSVSGFDAGEAQARLYDRAEAVPPLDGSYPVEMMGEVTGRLRADVQLEAGKASWFAVEAGGAGLLLIEAIAPGTGDPVLRLFDDLGRQVAYNDDSGSGLDSMIAARIQPGTYLIAVSDLGDEPSLMRMVIERYVPAE